ncbi:MAG: DUF4395 domain-containing protein [Actinomycetales bacterium]|nr:DUF4395 domain-containing protein [Actinomycetales bacterium]
MPTPDTHSSAAAFAPAGGSPVDHASQAPGRPTGIDPRGPRVGAGVTATLLAGVLLLGDGPGGRLLLALVTALFATGVVLGPARSVLGRAYAVLVAPRLAPATEREDPRPPRFAQTVGLVIAGAGLALALLGVPGALVVAAAMAFAAAFLNAAFGLCLGCELYLVIARWRGR